MTKTSKFYYGGDETTGTELTVDNVYLFNMIANQDIEENDTLALISTTNNFYQLSTIQGDSDSITLYSIIGTKATDEYNYYYLKAEDDITGTNAKMINSLTYGFVITNNNSNTINIETSLITGGAGVGVGGSGESGERTMIVAAIDENTATLPTTRPNGDDLMNGDIIRVKNSATCPFTIDGLTINNKQDTLYWASNAWNVKAGYASNTLDMGLASSSQESISGSSNNQSQANKEFKQAIQQRKIISNDNSSFSITNNQLNLHIKSTDKNTLFTKSIDVLQTINTSTTDIISSNAVYKEILNNNNSTFDFNDSTNDSFHLVLRNNNHSSSINKTINFTDKFVFALKNQVLENKTIDCNYNNVINIATENIDSSILTTSASNIKSFATSLDTNLITEKYLYKLIENIPYPQQAGHATNKQFVIDTISAVESGNTTEGIVSSTQPTAGQAGQVWFESDILDVPTVFPINVHRYINGAWEIATTTYSPDLTQIKRWVNINGTAPKAYDLIFGLWAERSSSVDVDDVTIKENLEAKIEVNYDNETITLNTDGELSVNYDDDTIKQDATSHYLYVDKTIISDNGTMTLTNKVLYKDINNVLYYTKTGNRADLQKVVLDKGDITIASLNS